MKTSILLTAITAVLLVGIPQAHAAGVELIHDDAKGHLQILIDGKEAMVYQYGEKIDLPHYFPVRSPSGKLLTVQMTDPFPHHRSFWFADTIQLAGQGAPMSFYNALYSQANKKQRIQGPYRERIRHVKFLKENVTTEGATIASQLIWEGEFGKLPVMEEVRRIRIVPLGKGEYFLDCDFKITAAYGDVTIRSDPVHYAWPFIRMHPQFAVERPAVPLALTQEAKTEKGMTLPSPIPEKGTGVITNSEGGVGQQATNMKPARWVDFSGTVDGRTEGLAIFSDAKQPPPKFLTRGYGTFGPRRPDPQSGTPFVLKKGDSLQQHVGILVHDGNVIAGKVKERYQLFSEGKL